MKKILLFSFILSFYFLNNSNAQGVKKYVLFEHYTNTGCAPCAQQNPFFKAFYDANTDRAHHIAFHTSWPSSSDPMYKYNIPDNTNMTTYYGVSGVPDMYANGNRIGSPVSANVGMLESAGTSPVKILLEQITNSDSIEATVKLLTKVKLDTGNYVMRVAVIEKLYKYSGAPNGEKEFPNVFRSFVANNVEVSFKELNQVQTFKYKFAIDKVNWVADQLYVLAYIVNTKTKEILNSGTSNDAKIDFLVDNPLKGNSDTLVYDFYVDNYSTENAKLDIRLTGDYPLQWTVKIENPNTIYVPGRNKFSAKVATNGIAGIGRFYIKMNNEDNSLIMTSGFKVINNISTLILTNNPPSATSVDITTPYLNGLNIASASEYGYLGYSDFINASNSGLLSKMKNIFLSVGWFFPAFNDEMIVKLISFLDNGGNLMVTGQDVGWDVLSGDSNANGTELQKSFMETYLKAKFIDDGSTASTSFLISATDPIYGTVGNSNINTIYGASYLYPDQIQPLDTTGHIFLTYKNNNKPGGYWVKNKNYKAVYMGIGPEQISNTNISNALIKTTKDWFDGLISSVEFDNLMKNNILGFASPNPADNQTEIQINNNTANELEFKLYDAFGKLLKSDYVSEGKSNYILNTSSLKNGLYFYSISDGKYISTKKLTILH